MYHIITDNEKILKYAKECEARVIEIKKPLVVEVGKKDKTIPAEVVDEFLRAFSNIDLESLGVQIIKYILENGLDCDNKDKVYANVAKKFRKNTQTGESAIMRTYAECIVNMPRKYQQFFDEYECSVHWERKYCFEFVKACQDYLIKNTAIVNNAKDKLHIIL